MRSSWATSAAKARRSRSSSSIASAILLKARAISPSSSSPSYSTRWERSPAAMARAARVSSRAGAVARRASTAPSPMARIPAAIPPARRSRFTEARNASSWGSTPGSGRRTTAVPTTEPPTSIRIRRSGPSGPLPIISRCIRAMALAAAPAAGSQTVRPSASSSRSVPPSIRMSAASGSRSDVLQPPIRA